MIGDTGHGYTNKVRTSCSEEERRKVWDPIVNLRSRAGVEKGSEGHGRDNTRAGADWSLKCRKEQAMDTWGKSLYSLEAFHVRTRELETAESQHCVLYHESVKLFLLLATLIVQMAEEFCLLDCNCGSSCNKP